MLCFFAGGQVNGGRQAAQVAEGGWAGQAAGDMIK